MSYLQKLWLAARWFLPQPEAEEMLADYRELLADGGEGREEDRFGPPVKAVLELAERKALVCWHGFVLVCAVLLMLPVIFAVRGEFEFVWNWLPMLALVILLFACFGIQRPKFSSLRRGAAVSFGLTLLLIILQCGEIYLLYAYFLYPESVLVNVLELYLRVFGQTGYDVVYLVLLALAGLASIVCARVLDRRWRGVTILIATVIVVFMYWMSVVHYMGPLAEPAAALYAAFWNSVFLSLAGLVISVVSLC